MLDTNFKIGEKRKLQLAEFVFFVNRGDLNDELPPRDVAADGFNAPLLSNVTRFNIKKLDCQTFFQIVRVEVRSNTTTNVSFLQ